jgi:protein farnesyltransferase/geranylgeranyltransferase type-1 subunit alpha
MYVSVVDTMNYFRAVIQAEEKSERALELTTDVISVNSANYTAWCGF